MAQKTCEGVALYESLKFCKGKAILPGLRSAVYYISKADIATYPTLPDKATSSMDELSILKGNFTLSASKKWHRIDLDTNKGQIEFETQGEVPSVTYVNKLTLTHPENDEEAAAFARQAANDDLLFLVPQRDGKWRLVGNEDFPTVVKVKGGSGEGVTGTAGTVIEVSATDVCPAPFYQGNLDADEGMIKCGEQASPEAA